MCDCSPNSKSYGAVQMDVDKTHDPGIWIIFFSDGADRVFEEIEKGNGM